MSDDQVPQTPDPQSPPQQHRVLYRHSFFVPTNEAAHNGEQKIRTYVGEKEICDMYATNDGQSGDIEIRFWTYSMMGSRMRHRLEYWVKPSRTVINREDWAYTP